MAVAPDIFAQGGGIQERLAMALQDPRMRERLLSQMPQIVEQLQGVGGPIAQRLGGVGQGGVDSMPPALQAEILRGGLGDPGGGEAPPFVPPGGGAPGGAPPFVLPDPGGVTGGPVATLPFFPPDEDIGPVDGGSPPFVPDLGGGGAPPFRPPGGADRSQAFADLRNQYGSSEQMADRRQKLQSELDEGRERRADRTGARPQPTKPDRSSRRKERQVRGGPASTPVIRRGGVARGQAPGLQTPRPSPEKKRRKQGAPPFVPSRGGAYGPLSMRAMR